MLKRLKDHIETNLPELFAEKIYLAISGGKDSVALCHLLVRIGIHPELLHCNFQLRGKESEEDEQFVKDLARDLNLKIQIKTFDIPGLIKTDNTNTQLLARRLRYDWFKEFINKFPNCKILTAHHALDNVETVLLNLCRGTGIKGLRGIPAQNENFVRPLLPFTQADILSFIENEQITFREDSSNSTRKYSRNKIRHDVIPVLNEIGGELEYKFSAVTSELNSANDWIHAEVQKFLNNQTKTQKDKTYFSLNDLRKIHTFFLFRLFESFQVNRKKHKEFVKFLSAKTGSLFFTEEFEFLIDREELIVRKKRARTLSIVSIHDLPFQSELFKIEFSELTDLNNKNFDFAISSIDLKFPLKLRPPVHGERIKLKNQPSKLISDILINNKINRFDKEDVFILEDATQKSIALLPIQICENSAESGRTILITCL